MKRALLTLSLCFAAGLVYGQEAPCHVTHPHRSREVVRQFERATGYPHGRPGFVVDHVVPLCYCGPDAVTNLQWQDRAAARAKDRWERALCAGKTSVSYAEWQAGRR